MIEKDLGFVLKRHNFRETSLILTLYTARFGKISGICKGFYSGKKEFSAHLDTFSLNEFVFYPKRNEIWLISHADLVSDFFFLRKDLSKMRVAAFLFNVVEKAMPLWDANYQIFNLINYCLNLLSKEKEMKVLYLFLIKFLTLSGFKPELDRCICCENSLQQESLFSISRGGFVCRRCSHRVKDIQVISQQASRSLAYIQKTDFPLVLRLNPTVACQEDIFYILREFMSYHFDFSNAAYSSIFKIPQAALK
ncbi:MAG: DNA repair protein RecO [Candidatus Omnitrophica bacterium]|nr:DNA repair protein RecO [Candidatus Omnitrophota bacterium]MDD5430236.1 DNA repair protein RecO [Candidatus Omnitrophota bacterium]